MINRGRALLAVLAAALAGVWSTAAADDWLPVTPEELHMTAEPKAPRAPAIYLYYQVDRDDTVSDELVYRRIKVLTDEGRKYADVEIPFDNSREHVYGISARSIRPDGAIVKFDGTVFEKTLVKGRGVKYLAKTFTLPDVQVGSILEYRFHRHMDPRYIYDSRWLLNDDLFTKHGKFTLTPYGYLALTWSWPNGLPAGSDRPLKKGARIQLETHDVEAFVTEDYMPPASALQQRVDFIYSDAGSPTDAKEYWAHVGKERFRKINSFIDHRRAMEKALAQIVAPDDTPDVKLHKIYARVQQLRNLSFERARTEEEEKREDLKTIHDADDVWERGYGDGDQLTWLFLALVKVAGFSADPVLIASRRQYFFQIQLMDGSKLNTSVVHVRLDDKDLYLDPGMAFAPFGMLPWDETGVPGLMPDKEGGHWITTPIPVAEESGLELKASLKLAEDGELSGRVIMTLRGLEALAKRVEERFEDAAARKRDLERSLQNLIPVGIRAALANSPDWDSSSPTLVAEFDLSIQGWATAAGSRRIVPVSLFGDESKHAFTHSTRVQPIYFQYPYRQTDDITIKLPASLRADSVPETRNVDLKAIVYRIAAAQENNELHLSRALGINATVIPLKYFDSVHDFFQQVRAGDEQEIVLVRAAGPAKH